MKQQWKWQQGSQAPLEVGFIRGNIKVLEEKRQRSWYWAQPCKYQENPPKCTADHRHRNTEEKSGNVLIITTIQPISPSYFQHVFCIFFNWFQAFITLTKLKGGAQALWQKQSIAVPTNHFRHYLNFFSYCCEMLCNARWTNDVAKILCRHKKKKKKETNM